MSENVSTLLDQCGAVSPASDQGRFVCVRKPGHKGHHSDNRVEWPDKMCPVNFPDASYNIGCGLEEGHSGHHASGTITWD